MTPGQSEQPPPGQPEDFPPGRSIQPPPGQPEDFPPGRSIQPPPGQPEDFPPGQSIQSPPGQPEDFPPGQSIQSPPGQPEDFPPGQSIQSPPGQPEDFPPGQSEQPPPGQPEDFPPGQSIQPPPGQPKNLPSRPSEQPPPDQSEKLSPDQSEQPPSAQRAQQAAFELSKPIYNSSEPEIRECGVMCWTADTTRNSKYAYQWYVVPASPSVWPSWLFGNAPPAGTAHWVGSSPAGNSAQVTFCLDPINFPPGDYVIAAERWSFWNTKYWIWSEWSNKLHYYPQVGTILHVALDGQTGWDLGVLPCDAPLIVTPLEQKCLYEYRVRIRRWCNGMELGPHVWLTGPNWIPAPLGSLDLRCLGAAIGFDFVPGQCYKLDVFAHWPVNGSQWHSTGCIFCLDCCPK